MLGTAMEISGSVQHLKVGLGNGGWRRGVEFLRGKWPYGLTLREGRHSSSALLRMIANTIVTWQFQHKLYIF
jgi:hypothetical protein